MAADQSSLTARERAYGLLADLIRSGLHPDREATVRGVEALADALPEPLDGPELAARHHGLFGLDVPPFESFFLAPDRLLGGPVSDMVARAYALGGFQPTLDDVAPDHLGVELAYLGWLSGARADAVRDGEAAHDRRIADLERAFLDDHLLRWLPVLVASVPDPDEFFGVCLDLALALAREHRGSLGVAPSPWSLPPLPELEDATTGLRQLAEALCTPCLAGGLLTRSAIAGLGRDRKLPRGFGDRTQTLANLFRSAARFDALDDVLGALDAHLGGWAHALAEHPHDAPWRARIAAHRQRLAGVRERAASVR